MLLPRMLSIIKLTKEKIPARTKLVSGPTTGYSDLYEFRIGNVGETS